MQIHTSYIQAASLEPKSHMHVKFKPCSHVYTLSISTFLNAYGLQNHKHNQKKIYKKRNESRKGRKNMILPSQDPKTQLSFFELTKRPTVFIQFFLSMKGQFYYLFFFLLLRLDFGCVASRKRQVSDAGYPCFFCDLFLCVVVGNQEWRKQWGLKYRVQKKAFREYPKAIRQLWGVTWSNRDEV